MKIKKIYKLILEMGIIKSLYFLYNKKYNKKRYNCILLDLLKKENLDLIKEYKTNEGLSIEKIEEDDIIWFFWWQGKDNMPILLQKCYESVVKYSGHHKVIFLSKDNFRTYANLPSNILNKLDEQKISLTHFSDILRMNLLSVRGGIWVDSTIYFTGDFTKEIDGKYGVYSRRSKKGSKFISNGKWTGYFLGTSKNNIIAKACYDIFCNYWEKHDFLIEYLLIDYVIYLLYTELENVKKEIDSLPFNNEGIHDLEEILDNTFNLTNYKNICKDTCVHKLNWKRKYRTHDESGNITYYGYLIGQNK